MSHIGFRGFIRAVILCLIFVAQTAAADTLSLPFPQGFVGTRGANSGQANAIRNFATLGVSKASFIQTSDSGAFGGTQGNDLSGTLRLVFNSGRIIDVPGAVNWRITQGSTLHYFGFIPAPGVATHVITYGSNQQYTLNANSNYGLRKIGSPQSYADGTNVSGNAATSGLVALLNHYLTVVTANGPKITGPSGAAGATTSAKTVDEDQTAITTLTADKTVSWSIFGGVDAAKFTINATTGVLTFLTPPDYEMPTDADLNNTYVVTVQATDSADYTAQQSVTVTVADLDDTAPTITGAPIVSVPEGQTAVTAFAANESVIWAIAGTDAAAFQIDATGVVTFVAAPDYDMPGDADGDNTYVLTITATDGPGNSSQQMLVVTVTEAMADTTPPVMTGPSGTGATQTVTVPDGQTAVATFAADEAVTWRIDGGDDAAQFTIDGATGTVTFGTSPQFAAPADADADNVYRVTIAATDSAGNQSLQSLSVTVAAPADTTLPIISGPVGGATDIAEGQTAVGTFTANEAVIWAISGVDAGMFSIDTAGALTFVAPPDFDAPGDADANNVYEVTVTAMDAAGNSSQQPLAVTVTEVVVGDTAPPIITGPADGAATVAEGQTFVANYSANEAVVWTIAGVDAGAFAVDAAGTISFIAAPDHDAPDDSDEDNIYDMTVVATDSAGNTGRQTLTVTVTGVILGDTAAPVIAGPAGGAATVVEGQTFVATYSADEVVVWAISGPDAASLQIDAAGAVTFIAAPDHGAPGDADGDHIYAVTITATDAAGNQSSQTLTITVATPVVTDMTPPVLTGPSGNSAAQSALVPEGQTIVATFTANEAVFWAVLGTDAAAFMMDPATGALSFVTLPDVAAPRDADGDNVYVVVIAARDRAGNETNQTLTVTVTPAPAHDTTPPVILGQSAQNLTQPEGQLTVVTLRADEPVTWAIAGGADQAAFVVEQATGIMRFLLPPDFDTPADIDRDNAYVVTVRATDLAGNTSTMTLTVTVLNAAATVAEIFESFTAEVGQIITEVEVNHLLSSLTALQGMTTAARDRFIAARRIRDRCENTAELERAAAFDDCSLLATRNDVPFSVDGQVHVDRNMTFTAGTFFGQTGSFSGTRRRVIAGDFSLIDNGAGIRTIDITGRIAWEHDISEHVMLGYFLGGSLAQAGFDTLLPGQSDKISLSMGTYFVAELRPRLYLDGFVSGVTSRNMLMLQNADIQLDGRYAARSLLMGVALSGVIERDGYELRPEIALAYGATKIGPVSFDATAEAMSETITAAVDGVNSATLRITPELRIPAFDGTATYIIAPSLRCDWTNGQCDCGAGLRLGLRGTSRNQRAQFDIMVDADRVGRENRVAVRANVEYRF